LRVDARCNVSCGRPFPGIEVRIDGEMPGEILVRGPAVFAGYFEAEEASREALRDGWLHTGDIGQLDADGHLYVLGRRRALLKRGGVPLAPRELEEAVAGVPGLRVAAAIGLPPASDAATEEIVLAVEADPQAALPQLAAAVAGAIEKALGFAPDRVVVLAPRTLPRTANGKIRHQVLRSELMDGELARRGAVLFNAQP
jgi:acyl-CoA synthetase (AMP-forming)/AMP-acid ligase II